MRRYPSTNDFRSDDINNTLIKTIEHLKGVATVPTSDISFHGRVKPAYQFLFNLFEGTSILDHASSSNIADLCVNLVKKFQWPNPYKDASISDAIEGDSYVPIAPIREVVRVLYYLYIYRGSSESYLTKDEAVKFVFNRASDYAKESVDFRAIVDDILNERILRTPEASYDEGLSRFWGFAINVLPLASTCFTSTRALGQRVSLNFAATTSPDYRNQIDFIYGILHYTKYWTPESTVSSKERESYSRYFDIDNDPDREIVFSSKEDIFVASDKALNNFAKKVFVELYEEDHFSNIEAIISKDVEYYKVDDGSGLSIKGLFRVSAGADATSPHYYSDYSFILKDESTFLSHDWYKSLVADSGSTGRTLESIKQLVERYYPDYRIETQGAYFVLLRKYPTVPSHIIYYGAPGTGKSYSIDKMLRSVPKSSVKRVTFYADYYYSDFVGGLRPSKEGDTIKYAFHPGPFAEALKESFIRPTYLIIEEINRGNPAAIFGDLFQLLDREDGRSRYSITNKDLYDYLCDDSEVASMIPENEIILPENLHILCTMNTADQNVFVLDTAFKRRFRMKYVPIDLTLLYRKGFEDYCKEDTIFKEQSGDRKIETILEGFDITHKKRDWPTFAAMVNAWIDRCNSSEPRISEDKKLGPFFATASDLSSRESFADKVLYYLKQDVFKYEETILTESYENMYSEYVVGKSDLFELFAPKKK